MERSQSSRMKRKRRKYNRNFFKNNFVNSSIKSLPNELLSEIVARVASSSFLDYINVKFSCKIFNGVSNDPYVYRHISLEEFPIGGCSWKSENEENENKLSLFMRTCMESGNPEALYRKGVVDFFRKERPEYAMKYLVKAAEAGHIGAEYVVSLIQVLMGEEVLKNNGIVAIGRMKATKPNRRALAEFRKNLVDILSNIWILNPIVFLGRQNSNWCSLHHKRSYKNKWRQWPSFDTDDDEDADFCCYACSCDEEIAHLVNILPTW
ncbi:putative F-box protein At1g67623 [Solanum verrucosum]|uniref:putative F-box protein At1g67623 n=1 Tax=Solanum verrucosum TaxID=315347 RepID=UPI0020D1640C|nr:putative F-box protein At1g67623 [Solanum verrucosum]